MDNDRDDRLELEGIVLESNKAVFKVQVSENHIVNCKLSGKLKLHEIKIIQNDRVKIQVSPYDLSVGRITARIREVKGANI